MHSISLDDREKTPNFGKPLFNPTSVLAVPETTVIGLRLYARENGAEKAVGEVYAKTLPKGVDKKTSMEPEKFVEAWKSKFSSLYRISALVSITPSDAGISQKRPIVFEVGVGGGDIAGQVDYVTKLLGTGVKFSAIFKPNLPSPMTSSTLRTSTVYPQYSVASDRSTTTPVKGATETILTVTRLFPPSLCFNVTGESRPTSTVPPSVRTTPSRSSPGETLARGTFGL